MTFSWAVLSGIEAETHLSEAVEEAWSRAYSGTAHELLLENINEIGYANPYSNTVAIIQSSGTGKSRTVHEMANLVFTLPFNIRSPKESTSMIA